MKRVLTFILSLVMCITMVPSVAATDNTISATNTDLSVVDFSANNLDYNYFIMVSDQLPCKRLILPKSIRQVNLSDHCPSLETLVIPADYFVPVYWMCLPYEDPILVQRNFKIEVPKHLLSAYQSDPQWNKVIFIDDDCREFHPIFVSLS